MGSLNFDYGYIGDRILFGNRLDADVGDFDTVAATGKVGIRYHNKCTAFFLKLFCCGDKIETVQGKNGESIYLNKASLQHWRAHHLIGIGAVFSSTQALNAICELRDAKLAELYPMGEMVQKQNAQNNINQDNVNNNAPEPNGPSKMIQATARRVVAANNDAKVKSWKEISGNKYEFIISYKGEDHTVHIGKDGKNGKLITKKASQPEKIDQSTKQKKKPKKTSDSAPPHVEDIPKPFVFIREAVRKHAIMTIAPHDGNAFHESEVKVISEKEFGETGYRFIFQFRGKEYIVLTDENGGGGCIENVKELPESPPSASFPPNPDVLKATKSALASLLGVNMSNPDSLNEFKLLRTIGVTWHSSALGLTLPEQVYTEEATPGYKIILEHKGQAYMMHANMTGSAKYAGKVNPGK